MVTALQQTFFQPSNDLCLSLCFPPPLLPQPMINYAPGSLHARMHVAEALQKKQKSTWQPPHQTDRQHESNPPATTPTQRPPDHHTWISSVSRSRHNQNGAASAQGHLKEWSTAKATLEGASQNGRCGSWRSAVEVGDEGM